jgi:hypothetical protein
MPEDTPQGEEQRTMLTFTEAAERLVLDGIARSMTAEGLRRLARDPASGWPITEKDYRVVGKTRTLPYDVLAPYMRERLGKRRGRGPDTRKRSTQPKQQRGESMTAQDEAPAVLRDEILQRLYRSYGARDVHTMSAAQKLLADYRAAVLTEAADRYQGFIDNADTGADPRYWTGIRDMVIGLRHMAAEQQKTEG